MTEPKSFAALERCVEFYAQFADMVNAGVIVPKASAELEKARELLAKAQNRIDLDGDIKDGLAEAVSACRERS
jgi:hypothetical protein